MRSGSPAPAVHPAGTGRRLGGIRDPGGAQVLSRGTCCARSGGRAGTRSPHRPGQSASRN